MQRLALRTARTPLRRIWPALYRLVARLAAELLTRGVPETSVYVRAGVASGHDLLPGLSDVDLAVVAGGGAEARVRARWDRLRRLPGAERVLDWPQILEQRALPALGGASAFTYSGAGYFGDGASLDTIRLLERPLPRGPFTDWRLIRGAERRPALRLRDAAELRLAVWLELLAWWRWAFLFCDRPEEPRAADLCVKLVAEPARAWLWLAHGEWLAGREAALRRVAELLPQEAPAARLALELKRELPAAPRAPFADVLPCLLRFTRRVAAELRAGEPEGEACAVRLVGAREPLPLADWPAVVAPAAFGAAFALAPGDPADPRALAAAVHAQGQRALRDGDLLVMPAAPLPRSRMRAVKSRETDPVSFALLDGSPAARFPALRGLSAAEVARRAVAEHGAWLRTRHVPPVPWAGVPPPSRELALLLSAARAALFHGSVLAGDPELVLTPEALGERLGGIAPEAVAAHAAGAAPADVAGALGALVRALPAYA